MRREQSKECIEISVWKVVEEDLKLRGFNIRQRRAELVVEGLDNDVYSKDGVGARGASKVCDFKRQQGMVCEVEPRVDLLPKECFSSLNGSPLRVHTQITC